MQTSVNLGGEAAFELQHGLLVYGDGHRSFATVHDILEGPRRGAPVLGPGRTLGSAFLKTLAKELGESLPVEILPPEVLVRTPALSVWWRPRREATLFFNLDGKTRDVKALAKLSGKRFPQPALVFLATSTGLWVRALAGADRPTATTPLYFAPYYNVGREGAVCLGSMRRPTSRGVDALAQWEAGFFGSEFTHPLPGAVQTRRKGGFSALWTSLAPVRGRGGKCFPTAALAPAPKGETLMSWIKAASRDGGR